MTLERRIRAEIEQRIHAGAWRPGDRILNEHELAAAYGCSRATVSKAMGDLARDGLIVRRRKAGSFVAHPHVHSAVLEIPDLPELIAARGEAYAWRRTLRRIAPAGHGLDRPSILVEGVHSGSDAAIALERRHIALDVAAALGEEQFTAEPPGTWLLRHVPWTAAEHRIAAVEAAPAEARALGVAPRTACLELQRTTWRAGETVTRVRQLFRGDRFDLVARFGPGAAAAR